MNRSKKVWSIRVKTLAIVAAASFLYSVGCGAGEHPEHPTKSSTGSRSKTVAQTQAREAKSKPQTKCPITGRRIKKNLYVDADGRRIYACSTRCIRMMKGDPEKYIKKIIENGQNPEYRLVLCTKCGEIKGTAKCCALNAEKCSKCNLSKGSPGCCNIQKGSKEKIILCPSCGETKGSWKCCAKNGRKCSKCGLFEGSPGCCKLSDIIGSGSKDDANKKSSISKGSTSKKTDHPR